MIEGALRTVAVVACLIVAAGFVLFAVDELSGASHRQQSEISGTAAPQPSATAPHKGLRGAIDRADGPLLKPFANIVTSSNAWVERGVPTLMALLVYGMGLGFLARYMRARA